MYQKKFKDAIEEIVPGSFDLWVECLRTDKHTYKFSSELSSSEYKMEKLQRALDNGKYYLVIFLSFDWSNTLHKDTCHKLYGALLDEIWKD